MENQGYRFEVKPKLSKQVTCKVDKDTYTTLIRVTKKLRVTPGEFLRHAIVQELAKAAPALLKPTEEE